MQVWVSSSPNTSIAITNPYSAGGATLSHNAGSSNDSFFSYPSILSSMPGWSPPHAIQLTLQMEVYTPLEFSLYWETFQCAMGAKEDTRNFIAILCLQHEERHTFMSPVLPVPQSRFGNVYYHCNFHCVRTVWPQFLSSSVVAPSSVSICLLPEYQIFLYAYFGI